MFKISCPNCSAPVVFRAGESVFAVCAHCRTALVRSDVSVENIGTVALLQDAWSPIQLGTEGDFDGGHFFVAGRVCYRWKQGTWSEWYLTYNDGRVGWLSEAQGFYALSFLLPTSEASPSLADLSLGTRLPIGGIPFQVADTKKATLDFSEGELPFSALPGISVTTVDLVAVGSREGSNAPPPFASIEYSERGTSVFLGRYEEFDNLRFTNLRVVDGW